MRKAKGKSKTGLTKELIEKICHMYVERDMTVKAIQEELRVAKMTVYRALRASGVPPKNPYHIPEHNRIIFAQGEFERGVKMRSKHLQPRAMNDDERPTTDDT